MRQIIFGFFLSISMLLTSSPAFAAEKATSAAKSQKASFASLKSISIGAVKFKNLGAHKRKVKTSSEEAQAYFDQGLALLYGFNHDEAARSFAKAGDLDPKCAMCWWGVSFALGPNYNIPMLPDRARAAWDALKRAQKTSKKAAPVEQAMIAALGKRYKGPEYVDPVAMQAYNQAFADAMSEVAKQFPDDLDVQAFYAESRMNLNAWKLWSNDGKPTAGTEEIVSILEAILATNPNHPGANHYYIHAIEASLNPAKGEAAADRLAGLLPDAGHAVHMPAHIYQRVGRYADASEANRRAVMVDNDYLKTTKPLGYYPFYLSHNHGFLAFSSSMEGRSAEALAASIQAAQTMPMDVVCGMPGMDFFLAEPLLVMVRFGKWDEIFKTPQPQAKYQVLNGLWHHAQGMALAATGKISEAQGHAGAIRKIRAELPAGLIAGLNEGGKILDLASTVVDASVASATKKSDAIELWKKAVAIEETLSYHEPADWFYPLRHYLGAALLDAGKAKEAEAVYREDLVKNPKNGWAYFGLWKALQAQKRKKEAKVAEADFKKAWAGADIQITRSAY